MFISGAKSKLENCVVKISNNYKPPGEKSLPKSLLKTSVEPKNMPLILQKVPSPFLNTKKYDAFPVDQTEVLNSLKGAVGNIGDSPENPIIFKLDIATSMDIFKNATLSKKVVKQTEVQEVNTRSVVTKRKSDPGELNLEKNPTKKLKIGCQSSIQLIKTKNLVPKQKAKFLVADNPQMNTPNQNVTAKVIGVIKCATNKNVTAVTKDSSKVTTLDGQAKKPQTNSKVLGSVLTSTNFHEKVDSASCIIQESLLLNQKRKVEKPISIKNEFKKEDLLHSTVIDLTDENPTSSKAIQPLEAANLSAKSIQYTLSKHCHFILLFLQGTSVWCLIVQVQSFFLCLAFRKQYSFGKYACLKPTRNDLLTRSQLNKEWCCATDIL